MALGNKSYMKDMRKKFEFQTFSDYWDESYDDVDDCRKAIKIITDNMKYINSLSNDKLTDMISNMKDILIHNNIKARNYLEGAEPWIDVMKNWIDKKGKAWRGRQVISPI